MAMLVGGTDMSNDRLDLMVLPEEQRSSVTNDAAGWPAGGEAALDPPKVGRQAARVIRGGLPTL